VPLAFGDYIARQATFFLNGKVAGEITIASAQPQIITHTVDLAGHCIEAAKIDLQFKNLRSPIDLGINDDPRRLSWGFNWFSIEGK
jgi:hypothetical protein